MKFDKYGRTSDGKYVCAIGMPSAGADSKYSYSYWKTIFYNHCPRCGKDGTLYWGWNFGNKFMGNYESGGSIEGHLFCVAGHGHKGCDADFSCISGQEHVSGSKYYVKQYSKPVKSSKAEALKMLHSGLDYSTGSDDSTATGDTDKTIGYDTETPFKGVWVFGYDKLKPNQTFKKYKRKYNKRRHIVVDFTSDSNIYVDGYSPKDFTAVMKNNNFTFGEFDILNFIRDRESDTEKKYKYYLTDVSFEYHSPKSQDLYDAKGTDTSTYKILLKSIGLNNGMPNTAKSFDACGKTVLDSLKEVLECTDYSLRLNYADYRKDDNFEVIYNASNNPVFTIREDDDRFLNLSNVQYNASKYYTRGLHIYKETDYNDNAYYNIARHLKVNNALRYGAIEYAKKDDDNVSSGEALYNLSNDEEFIHDTDYSYTVEWEGVPPIRVGDYVKCIMDSTVYLGDKTSVLSGVKRVESLSYECSNEDACNIRTTIGLNQISPVLGLKKRFQDLRTSLRKQSTSYKAYTEYTNESIPYTFGNDEYTDIDNGEYND